MERQVLTYRSLVSTNFEASRLLSEGRVSGPVFLRADYQENGKGQGQNSWVSDSEKNLLMSWIVFPAFLSVELQFQLSKAVSLAISDLFLDFSIPCRVKWPNDIVCENKKVAGILIENSLLGSILKSSIIGIGVNVNQLDFPDFPYQAASMQSLSKRVFDLEELSKLLMTKLEYWYDQLQSGDDGTIDKLYLERLFRLNEISNFSKGKIDFKASIRGVSEIGELLLETNEGIKSYGFHEIKIHY